MDNTGDSKREILHTPWKKKIIPIMLRCIRDNHPSYNDLESCTSYQVLHCNPIDVQFACVDCIRAELINVIGGRFFLNLTDEKEELINSIMEEE